MRSPEYQKLLADLASAGAYKTKSSLHGQFVEVPGSDLFVIDLYTLQKDLSAYYGAQLADRWGTLSESQAELLLELRQTPNYEAACLAFVESLTYVAEGSL